MNFYKHHLGDYADATAHLSWDEDLAYTRLLRVYYRNECPIPVGSEARLCRASTRAQRKAVAVVLSEFFFSDGKFWRNKRADAEIAAYQAQRAVNTRVGKLGGRPRTNRSETDSVTDRNPNHEPLTTNQNQNQKKTTSTPIAPSASLALDAAGGNGAAITYLPLNDGSEYPILQSDVDELERLYPALDVKQTLNEIRGWNLANKAKRKTKRGIMAHVHYWCSKEQNRAR